MTMVVLPVVLRRSAALVITKRHLFSTSSVSGPITEAYQKLIKSGSKQNDENQFAVAKKLDKLHRLLKSTDSRVIDSHKLQSYPTNTWFEKGQSYLQKLATFQPKPPKGLYIYGSVGVGKSFLMDLFHNISVSNNEDNRRGIRRVHFHEFMLDVHSRIHQYKQQYPRGDALPEVALSFAKEARILCFDEFQITDIADAMIIKRLFELLIHDQNVVVVATSNRAPSQLYEGGINRDSFLPFLDTLQESMHVIEMTGQQDYRRQINEDVEDSLSENSGDSRIITSIENCYLSSKDPETPEKLHQVFKSLGGGDNNCSGSGKDSESVTLTIPMGRTIHVARANDNCAWFDFSDLCFEPLGSADYLTICERFPVIIITNIPQLDSSKINEARRFVTLIDALYECQTKLIASLDEEVPKIEDLFVDFDVNVESNDGDEEIAVEGKIDDNKVTTASTEFSDMYVKGEGGSSSSSSTTMLRTKDGKEEMEWSATGRIGVSLAQLSSVQDVSFSFQRAESRLQEMKRKAWGRLFASKRI